MGEAWFQAEVREMYTWLLERDDAEYPVVDLQIVFKEIALGLTSMGDQAEWYEWFGYLLPRCIPRAFDEYASGYLVEYLVTAFMTVMPNSSDEWGYPSFKNDALITLGRAIMSRQLWPRGSKQSLGCLHPRDKYGSGYPVWADVSGDFSASMFFCLKYLNAEDVQGWIGSVFSIPCPRWRAQTLVWLCGAKAFLDGTISHPCDAVFDQQIEWEWSHIVSGSNMAYNEWKETIEFLPAENRARCLETVNGILNEQLLTDWLESFMELEHLFDHLTATAIPERLRTAYQF